jgi:hypothetical protein
VLLFAVLAAAGSGLAIGLRFRVNMLFAASVLFGLGTIAVAIHSGWSITHTIAILLLLLGVQQGAYLLGLVLAARKPSSAREFTGETLPGTEPRNSDPGDRSAAPAKRP